MGNQKPPLLLTAHTTRSVAPLAPNLRSCECCTRVQVLGEGAAQWCECGVLPLYLIRVHVSPARVIAAQPWLPNPRSGV
ncbi:hypothetical protein EJ02DRAFT_452612 [Clathrospora elynae]|uniref:Uncharacterized protein n=1 Tax=Clathrospora elynae TaxID=706981 RepID=A0A6A5SWX1_9PLEO|nr:hypothetical protein EJ02DRAFT_452612 [Clathrospora elynae]